MNQPGSFGFSKGLEVGYVVYKGYYKVVIDFMFPKEFRYYLKQCRFTGITRLELVASLALWDVST